MSRAPGCPIVRARLVVAGAALVLTGCGGSLADADRPDPTRARHAPPGDFCAAVLAGAEAARPLAALVERGGSVPREEITAAAEQVRSANADVLATAPGEIRADVEQSLAEADMQLDALEAAGGDAAAVARDAAARRTQVGQDYTAATARVRDYVSTHCGIASSRRVG
jgi:hypothetical protein